MSILNIFTSPALKEALTNFGLSFVTGMFEQKDSRAALRRAIVQTVNQKIDLPNLTEEQEEALIAAVYDAITSHVKTWRVA